MSDTELVRDPLDVAADEAAKMMTDWKDSRKTWNEFLDYLQREAEEAGRRKLLAMRIHAQFIGRDDQLPLIPGVVAEPKKPRAKSRRMMHENEAGEFRCPKCKAMAVIPNDMNVAARKRGIPCPTCNGAAAEEEAVTA